MREREGGRWNVTCGGEKQAVGGAVGCVCVEGGWKGSDDAGELL